MCLKNRPRLTTCPTLPLRMCSQQRPQGHTMESNTADTTFLVLAWGNAKPHQTRWVSWRWLSTYVSSHKNVHLMCHMSFHPCDCNILIRRCYQRRIFKKLQKYNYNVILLQIGPKLMLQTSLIQWFSTKIYLFYPWVRSKAETSNWIDSVIKAIGAVQAV